MDNISYRGSYLAVHFSTSGKNYFFPHCINSLRKILFLAAKSLRQSFYPSPPFRPGYLSALKDSRKVHAQQKISRPKGYASRGIDLRYCLPLYTRYIESAWRLLSFTIWSLYHFPSTSFVRQLSWRWRSFQISSLNMIKIVLEKKNSYSQRKSFCFPGYNHSTRRLAQIGRDKGLRALLSSVFHTV